VIKLQPGETVLITAASGGVGTMAVQIAVALGARVFGVVSARNLEYVRSLGASEVFDYGQPGWAAGVLEAAPGGVDALFDGAGGETGQEALKGIRSGGRGAFIAYPPPQIDPATGITAEVFSALVNRERLEAVAALVPGGRLRVEVEKVFPSTRPARPSKRCRVGTPAARLSSTSTDGRCPDSLEVSWGARLVPYRPPGRHRGSRDNSGARGGGRTPGSPFSRQHMWDTT
jgi:NADPH:quinone reductase